MFSKHGQLKDIIIVNIRGHFLCDLEEWTLNMSIFRFKSQVQLIKNQSLNVLVFYSFEGVY